MARVYRPKRKKPDGSTWTSAKWYIEYTDHKGRQQRKPASKVKKEAQRILRETEVRESRLKHGLEVAPVEKPESPTINDLRERFLRAMPSHISPRTLSDYTADLARLFDGPEAWLKGIEKVEDLNPRVITRYQEKASKRLAPRTVNKMLGALSSMLGWSLRQGHIETNPILGAKHLKLRPKPKRVFEDAELEELIEVSQPDARDCWILLADLGLRRSELSNLTVGDVFKGEVVIQANKSKNGRERRIPPTNRVREILDRRSKDKGPEDPIIERIENRTKVYDGLGKALKESLQATSYDPKGLTLHVFRRTFITRLLSNGVPPQVAQRLAGHSTSVLTLECYAQIRDGDFTKAIETLN